MRPHPLGWGLIALWACGSGSVLAPNAALQIAPPPSASSRAGVASAAGSPPVPSNSVAKPNEPSSSGVEPAPPADALAASLPSLTIEIERPYSAHGHPPLATDMQTLERDEDLMRWSLGGSSDPNAASNRAGYHPATRVVIDVALLSRAPKGSTKKLLRIARSRGYWPFRSCFERAERIAPRKSRTARVRFTLSPHGKVLAARRIGATAEPDFAKCVLDKARALSFEPGAGRRLDLELNVQLWTGDAPVPPRATEEQRLVGTGAVETALASLLPLLESCYRGGLERDSALWGRLALKVELSAEGSVLKSEQLETRFPDEQVVSCVQQALRDQRLPDLDTSSITLAFRFGQPPLPPPPTAESPAAPSPPLPEGAPPVPPAP